MDLRIGRRGRGVLGLPTADLLALLALRCGQLAASSPRRRRQPGGARLIEARLR
jgi:hypothetical protein